MREHQLVKETAEALARQFVDHPSQREPVAPSLVPPQSTVQGNREVVPPIPPPVVRQSYVAKVVSNIVTNPTVGQVQQPSGVEPRAVDTLMAVAGSAEQGGMCPRAVGLTPVYQL